MFVCVESKELKCVRQPITKETYNLIHGTHNQSPPIRKQTKPNRNKIGSVTCFRLTFFGAFWQGGHLWKQVLLGVSSLRARCKFAGSTSVEAASVRCFQHAFFEAF